MPPANTNIHASLKDSLRELFYQRTLICLWLAVVFFSLFSLLDFVYCRNEFSLFLLYRLSYVATILLFIHLLKIDLFQSFTRPFMYAAMVFGAFAISLMTVELGGFYSGYYVGMLLMIAGALSVLPLRTHEVFFTGVSMYIIYIATVIIGTGDLAKPHLEFALNNSFFFLSIVAITAVQSFDDLNTLIKSTRARSSIQKIRRKLASYANGLESTIQERLRELKETDLRYQDLYDNMMDMVVLIDAYGVIHHCNRQANCILDLQPHSLQKYSIRDFVFSKEDANSWLSNMVFHLNSEATLKGLQLTMVKPIGEVVDVELSASKVNIAQKNYFQLVIRDISDTKRIERELLDSERLIGTSRQTAIFGLAKLAECRDDDTGAHLSRISSYTHILLDELANLPELQPLITDRFIEEVVYSAVLHDIGKVGIPDSILLKPGKLTTDEFELMKKHTVFGSEVLASADNNREELSFLNIGQEIARSHHERWDASGYPDGLTGEDIPLAARIISLADVYDALTSTRVYKPPFSHEESKKIILQESGKQFDPRVVNAFLQREYDFKEARMKLVLQQDEQVRQ